MNEVYIKKGENIITRNGCTCKNKYTVDNETYENTCNIYNTINPWCMVEGECGSRVFSGNFKNRWYDYCNLDSNILYKRPYPISNNKLHSDFRLNNIKGLLVFIIIFLVIIPLILHVLNKNEYIMFYYPNIISIATSISFGYSNTNKGLRKDNIFQQLYNTETDLLIGFINTNFINYIALISVIFLIITHVKFEYIISRGLILFIILLIITYLLPEKTIMNIQKKIYTYILGKFDKDSFLYKYVSEICILFGLCISLIFIFCTYLIFNNNLKNNYVIHQFIQFYRNIFK